MTLMHSEITLIYIYPCIPSVSASLYTLCIRVISCPLFSRTGDPCILVYKSNFMSPLLQSWGSWYILCMSHFMSPVLQDWGPMYALSIKVISCPPPSKAVHPCPLCTRVLPCPLNARTVNQQCCHPCAQCSRAEHSCPIYASESFHVPCALRL